MTEDNKAIVRLLVEEVRNRHDVDCMDVFFAPYHTMTGSAQSGC